MTDAQERARARNAEPGELAEVSHRLWRVGARPAEVVAAVGIAQVHDDFLAGLWEPKPCPHHELWLEGGRCPVCLGDDFVWGEMHAWLLTSAGDPLMQKRELRVGTPCQRGFDPHPSGCADPLCSLFDSSTRPDVWFERQGGFLFPHAYVAGSIGQAKCLAGNPLISPGPGNCTVHCFADDPAFFCPFHQDCHEVIVAAERFLHRPTHPNWLQVPRTLAGPVARLSSCVVNREYDLESVSPGMSPSKNALWEAALGGVRDWVLRELLLDE